MMQPRRQQQAQATVAQHSIHAGHRRRPIDAVEGAPAADKQAGHDAL